jgi:hypothetical protein
MGERVVDLAEERERRRPHTAGKVLCLACSHRWTAAVPVGVAELECPSCGLVRGVWCLPLELEVGTHKWVCDCGADLFKLADRAAVCARCGAEQSWRPLE